MMPNFSPWISDLCLNQKYHKVGVICGAFDILHPGYIKAFKEAKQYCEILVVCVHADPSIERPHKAKPVLSVEERMEVLQAIRYVDEVYSYATETDRIALIRKISPDVRFLGDDYKGPRENFPEIPVIFLDRSHGWSATKLKQMICESEKR